MTLPLTTIPALDALCLICCGVNCLVDLVAEAQLSTALSSAASLFAACGPGAPLVTSQRGPGTTGDCTPAPGRFRATAAIGAARNSSVSNTQTFSSTHATHFDNCSGFIGLKILKIVSAW